jgi:hypothetical protein
MAPRPIPLYETSHMFDGRAFRSWPHIVSGAVVFAGLFMTVAMMSELVFEGRFGVTRAAIGIGAGAFIGYVATAWLVRPAHPPKS